MDRIYNWIDGDPVVGENSYGVYYPVDNSLVSGFSSHSEAEKHRAYWTSGNGAGGYVVRVQIERV